MNTRDQLLECIDLEVFLNNFAPGEWERFGDVERAFDWFTEDMSPEELLREINESECRLEQQKQDWWTQQDQDDNWIEQQLGV